jgi:serine phosphatase RsbU (regulator of sigma subunit)
METTWSRGATGGGNAGLGRGLGPEVTAASARDAVGEPRERPTTPALPARASLEVQVDGGPVSRRWLRDECVVLGRVPGVDLVLDHHTVSRRHAEVFCDPFGRFWVRDLGSTNGTLVDGTPVREHLLSPGERISIGAATLTFQCHEGEGAPPARRSAPLVFERATEIHTLLDFEPPRVSAAHLHTLLELGRRLGATESPEARLEELCRLAVRPDFHGATALALRVEDGLATPLSPTFLPGGGASDEPPRLSQRVLAAVRERCEPVLAGNLHGRPPSDHELELTVAPGGPDTWVVACPLRSEADALDLLYVTLPPSHGSAEWLALFALAAEVFQQSEASRVARRHAEAQAAIERELCTARQIQRALLPTRLSFPGLDVALGFEPCRWVGGDWVDAVPLSDGRVLLAVADVCGKGLHAALVTAGLHTMVRASAEVTASPAALLERVDRHLCAWLPAHSFVTLVAVAVDPATGEIECVNAGHPPPFVARAGGGLTCLQEGANPALGVAPHRIEARRDRIELGDVLLLYTDGLSELRDASGEMLGQARLGAGFVRLSTEGRGRPSADLARGLDGFVERFQAGRLPTDDRAFLVAQRRG